MKDRDSDRRETQTLGQVHNPTQWTYYAQGKTRPDSLVVEQDVAALDVPVEEVLAVTVAEAVEQLSHDAGV